VKKNNLDYITVIQVRKTDFQEYIMETIDKYPRTPHAAGSRLQKGDTAEGQVSLREMQKKHPNCRMIIEEKLDGAQTGLSYSDELEQRLQSRGHYLNGGAREGQFNLFKEWANVHDAALMERLENRFTMYGEWCFARHTQFYDALPHYFFEFDILDRQTGAFLSTPARQELLSGLPVVSVPVLADDWPGSEKELLDLVGTSSYRSAGWRESLLEAAKIAGVEPEQALAECGPSADLMEGLYLKIEKDGETVGRYKWVHPDFVQTIIEGGVHWSQRPMIRNGLAHGVDLFNLPNTKDLEVTL
jgi:hypothetical protein